MKVSFYDNVTGQILKNMDATEDVILLNQPEGSSMLEGIFDLLYYYVEGGEPVAFPPKPVSESVWNWTTKSWEDLRTESNWTDENLLVREKTSISRIDFILRCKEANILSEEEGLIAVKGDFPPTFQTIVDSLPEEERFEAAVRWAAATEIDRMNPLIVNMATAIGIDEWILDTVFGIVWPAPLPSWPAGQLHPIYEG